MFWCNILIILILFLYDNNLNIILNPDIVIQQYLVINIVFVYFTIYTPQATTLYTSLHVVTHEDGYGQ